jgi:hypothetical protein
MAITGNRSTTSAVVDKINYVESQNILENANASRYMQIISKEDLLRNQLKSDDKLKSIAEENPKIFVLLSYIFQSVTNRGLFTQEIVEYIADAIDSFPASEKKKISDVIGEYITVFHMDYEGFFDKNKLQYANKFLFNKNSSFLHVENIKVIGRDPNNPTDDEKTAAYNLNTYLNVPETRQKFVNLNLAKDKRPTKDSPSLSAIMLHSNNLRCGAKNALEISAFFNMISTLEYAKAYPYFNATFVLPSTSKQDATNIFKTATLNQFLFGSNTKGATENFNSFEGRIVKDKNKVGVNTNLSIFTSPQTMVNMDEKVGHNDQSIKDNSLRITTVHDQTRPFMTLKDFTIDVSPTQGLMSFKTGKMSLVLHDRTRMVDIAPFIKPDLFGAFGAEIVVEYGWSHNQGQERDAKGNIKNPIGAFLNSSRCVEKYMIVNSQFTIENNGQVNINLSIAMKGPIDIRQTEITTDRVKAMQSNDLDRAIADFSRAKNAFIRASRNGNGGDDFNSIRSVAGNVFSKQKISPRDKIVINNAKNHLKTIAEFFKSVSVLDKIYFEKESDLSRAKVVKDYFGIELKKDTNSFTTKLNIDSLGSLEKIKARDDTKKAARDVRAAALSLKSSIENILTYDENLNTLSKSYVESLIGGIKTDFFISKNFNDKTEEAQKTNQSISGFVKSDHITLGSIITSIIGTHMSSTKKYDEIQIIYHNVNRYTGLAGNVGKDGSPLNIASIPINKSQLEKYLDEVFTSETVLTIEALISQIITKFVMTKDNPMYGLDDLYKRKKVDEPVKPVYKNKKFKTKSTLKNPEDRLNYYYYDKNTDLYDPSPRLVPPSIHMSFDTLTTSNFEDAGQDLALNFQPTICRINVYDRNDNPYQEISNIYNSEILGNNSGASQAIKILAFLINKEKLIAGYEKRIKEIESKRKKKRTKDENKELESLKALKKAEESKVEEKTGGKDLKTKYQELKKILTDPKEGLYVSSGEGNEQSWTMREGNDFGDLKEKYKSIIPSATFSTQNTSLINASVATVNEGKLNTVYITRSDRNGTEELNRTVNVDMPLRILPAQASIEIFGCPWINFGQFIFLDFETGTTIDNAYAVTGIQHTITPGGFKTRVSLSYGDVYGKYEGYANTFSQLVKRINDGQQVSEEVQKQIDIEVRKEDLKKKKSNLSAERSKELKKLNNDLFESTQARAAFGQELPQELREEFGQLADSADPTVIPPPELAQTEPAQETPQEPEPKPIDEAVSEQTASSSSPDSDEYTVYDKIAGNISTEKLDGFKEANRLIKKLHKENVLGWHNIVESITRSYDQIFVTKQDAYDSLVVIRNTLLNSSEKEEYIYLKNYLKTAITSFKIDSTFNTTIKNTVYPVFNTTYLDFLYRLLYNKHYRSAFVADYAFAIALFLDYFEVCIRSEDGSLHNLFPTYSPDVKSWGSATDKKIVDFDNIIDFHTNNLEKSRIEISSSIGGSFRKNIPQQNPAKNPNGLTRITLNSLSLKRTGPKEDNFFNKNLPGNFNVSFDIVIRYRAGRKTTSGFQKYVYDLINEYPAYKDKEKDVLIDDMVNFLGSFENDESMLKPELSKNVNMVVKYTDGSYYFYNLDIQYNDRENNSANYINSVLKVSLEGDVKDLSTDSDIVLENVNKFSVAKKEELKMNIHSVKYEEPVIMYEESSNIFQDLYSYAFEDVYVESMFLTYATTPKKYDNVKELKEKYDKQAINDLSDKKYKKEYFLNNLANILPNYSSRISYLNKLAVTSIFNAFYGSANKNKSFDERITSLTDKSKINIFESKNLTVY